MKLTEAFITVTDHEAAKAFSTDVLGFSVVTDYSADGFRWLEMRADDQDASIGLVLEQASDEGLRFLDARRAAGSPAFSFTLTREDEFEEIRRRGAKVVSEPEKQEYGGTDALIDDGVGNIVNLHRD